MRLLVCSYHGWKVVATQTISNGVLQTASSRWARKVHKAEHEREVTLRLVEGAAASAGVGRNDRFHRGTKKSSRQEGFTLATTAAI